MRVRGRSLRASPTSRRQSPQQFISRSCVA